MAIASSHDTRFRPRLRCQSRTTLLQDAAEGAGRTRPWPEEVAQRQKAKSSLGRGKGQAA